MDRKRTVAPQRGRELSFVDLDSVMPHDDWTDLEQELFWKFWHQLGTGEAPAWWIDPSTDM